MQNNYIVRQINAFAMQDGIVLGIFGLTSLWVFKWSFTMPFFSTLFGVMLLGSPALGLALTLRFRTRAVGQTGGFSFFHGFLHALFMGFYASIWVALGTFIYLQYFDHGTLFAAYEQSLQTPQMAQYLNESGLMVSLNTLTNGNGVKGIGDIMRNVGAANYAAISLYNSLIIGPVIAAIIGLIARRSTRRGR